ncbi:MAG: acyltransferase [Myxococcota bacterium]
MIHPSAVVDPGACIGAGTKIWHFCHVMGGARIGRDCVLGQNGFVAATATIGDRCRIQNNVSVYDGVTLEDDVFLGPSCVLTNVKNPRATVSRREAYLPTRLRTGVTIGANATIVCGVTVGAHAMVGAGAVVTSDVSDFALMTGVPARRRGWVSRRGCVLPPADPQGFICCPESGERYREEHGTLRLA